MKFHNCRYPKLLLRVVQKSEYQKEKQNRKLRLERIDTTLRYINFFY